MRVKWASLPINKLMNCQEFNRLADSYLAGELLVETNHGVLQHLENCAECRRDLAAQRDFRGRLKSAVKNSTEMNLNADFRIKLRSDLYQSRFPKSFGERVKNFISANYQLTTLATACLLLAALGGFWLAQRDNYSAPEIAVDSQVKPNILPPDANIVLAARRETIEKAVGDHKNCAIKYNLAESPISLEEAAAKYGKFNLNLDRAVINAIKERKPEKSADKIEFLEAHSCIFGGRRFAHLVVSYRQSVVSILVTQPDFPEQSDAQISLQAAQNNRVADFHAGRHEVFVISDLDERDNLQIAQIFQPVISRHIKEYEI